MNKMIAALIAIVVVAGGIFVLMSGDDESTDEASNQTNNTSQVEQTSESDDAPEDIQQITAIEVAEHATADDCWTIINGNVYDITSYVPRHPGGDEILRACGADGTSLFSERKTDDGESVGSGTPHSGNATAQLMPLIIGQLAQ